MNRTMRLNAYQGRERAEEEAAGLRLAFANHPLATRHGFIVDVSPYQGEFHVTVSADVDTSTDGFLSVIVARVLASHCRAPTTPMQLPRPQARPVGRISQSPAAYIDDERRRQARIPRFPQRGY